MDSCGGLTAGEVAALVGGELTGDPTVTIAGVAPIERARPGDLAFVASSRVVPMLETCNATVLLLARALRDRVRTPAITIVVDNPYEALALLLNTIHPPADSAWGIHPTAHVGRGTRWQERIAVGARASIGAHVRLGARCRVGEHAVIAHDVRVGDDCVIGPDVVIETGTRLGDRVIVHAGARIGTAGYGFVPDDPEHASIPHIGGCVIGDDVEIGANTTVDRGTLEATTIGDATKIDNLVQIGHNCHVGRRCLIMAQVGLAGSTVLEDDVILAGQAGLAGHLRVGRGARVAAQGGVIGDVPAGATVSGYPARDHRQVLRQSAALRRLTPIAARLEALVRGHAVHTP